MPASNSDANDKKNAAIRIPGTWRPYFRYEIEPSAATIRRPLSANDQSTTALSYLPNSSRLLTNGGRNNQFHLTVPPRNSFDDADILRILDQQRQSKQLRKNRSYGNLGDNKFVLTKQGATAGSNGNVNHIEIDLRRLLIAEGDEMAENKLNNNNSHNAGENKVSNDSLSVGEKNDDDKVQFKHEGYNDKQRRKGKELYALKSKEIILSRDFLEPRDKKQTFAAQRKLRHEVDATAESYSEFDNLKDNSELPLTTKQMNSKQQPKKPVMVKISIGEEIDVGDHTTSYALKRQTKSYGDFPLFFELSNENKNSNLRQVEMTKQRLLHIQQGNNWLEDSLAQHSSKVNNIDSVKLIGENKGTINEGDVNDSNNVIDRLESTESVELSPYMLHVGLPASMSHELGLETNSDDDTTLMTTALPDDLANSYDKSSNQFMTQLQGQKPSVSTREDNKTRQQWTDRSETLNSEDGLHTFFDTDQMNGVYDLAENELINSYNLAKGELANSFDFSEDELEHSFDDNYYDYLKSELNGTKVDQEESGNRSNKRQSRHRLSQLNKGKIIFKQTVSNKQDVFKQTNSSSKKGNVFKQATDKKKSNSFKQTDETSEILSVLNSRKNLAKASQLFSERVDLNKLIESESAENSSRAIPQKPSKKTDINNKLISEDISNRPWLANNAHEELKLAKKVKNGQRIQITTKYSGTGNTEDTNDHNLNEVSIESYLIDQNEIENNGITEAVITTAKNQFHEKPPNKKTSFDREAVANDDDMSENDNKLNIEHGKQHRRAKNKTHDVDNYSDNNNTFGRKRNDYAITVGTGDTALKLPGDGDKILNLVENQTNTAAIQDTTIDTTKPDQPK